MSNLAVAIGISFEATNCITCGKYFALSLHEYNKFRKSHISFYCPYCKTGQYFSGKSEEEKLKEQLAAEKRGKDLAQRQAAQERVKATHHKNVARAQKGAHTRTKNRIKNGVCPCCNRYFANVHKHMQTVHPDHKDK